MNRHKPKLAPDLAKRAERLTATIAALKVKRRAYHNCRPGR